MNKKITNSRITWKWSHFILIKVPETICFSQRQLWCLICKSQNWILTILSWFLLHNLTPACPLVWFVYISDSRVTPPYLGVQPPYRARPITYILVVLKYVFPVFSNFAFRPGLGLLLTRVPRSKGGTWWWQLTYPKICNKAIFDFSIFRFFDILWCPHYGLFPVHFKNIEL